MQASFKEDLANHFGLELYADDGYVTGVATTLGFPVELTCILPNLGR